MEPLKVEPGRAPGAKEDAAAVGRTGSVTRPLSGLLESGIAAEAAEGRSHGRREMARDLHRVERLRQEVHRLHSRVWASSRDHTETGETNEEKPSPPSSRQPRPVMAFTPQGPRRRGHQTPSIPCAFWERNYLGRFHLRMSR